MLCKSGEENCSHLFLEHPFAWGDMRHPEDLKRGPYKRFLHRGGRGGEALWLHCNELILEARAVSVDSVVYDLRALYHGGLKGCEW